MPGTPPLVAAPADRVDGHPLSPPDAADALGAVPEQVPDALLRPSHAVEPVFAREPAARLAARVERDGERLRTAFALRGRRATGVAPRRAEGVA